ncbi:MAG TPA: hypothetical protein VFE78_12060 [Gemmataceae bacterium]|nr:hypothetical protein [Gemmataceae bacterium]
MRKCVLGALLLAAAAGVWVSDSEACGRRRHGRCQPCVPCWGPVWYQVAPCPSLPVVVSEAPAPTMTTRKGRTYRLITTNDRGSYEHDLPAPSLTGAPKPSDGIHFAGSARRVAKTSVAAAPTETFETINDLLDPLLTDDQYADATMRGKVKTSTPRVAEEKRNVTVKAFLYATKKEADNDYHLLLGPDPANGDDGHYMTAEISGLPSPANAATAKLTAARKQFEDFIRESGGALPGSRYMRFDPPVPVEVTGSMFFDTDHHPGDVGTGAVVPQSVWEIHPVTNIVFEP